MVMLYKGCNNVVKTFFINVVTALSQRHKFPLVQRYDITLSQHHFVSWAVLTHLQYPYSFLKHAKVKYLPKDTTSRQCPTIETRVGIAIFGFYAGRLNHCFLKMLDLCLTINDL